MVIFMKISLVVLWAMMGLFFWQVGELFIATESFFNTWEAAIDRQSATKE